MSAPPAVVSANGGKESDNAKLTETQAANDNGTATGSTDSSTSDSSASDELRIYRHKKRKKKDRTEASHKAKKKSKEKNKKHDPSRELSVHPDHRGWQMLMEGNRLVEFVRYVEPRVIMPYLQAEGAITDPEAQIINKQETRQQQVLTMFDMLRRRDGALRTFVRLCKETKQCLHLINRITEQELQPVPTTAKSVLYQFVSRLYRFIETKYTRWSLAYVYEFSGATNIGTDDHWVNLKLSKKPTTRMREELADKVDCEYVTKWIARGIPVVIKGEPGMGKTTFLKKICYDWLHPEPLEGQPSPSAMAAHLQNYSLLLPVEMRSAEKSDGLLEMAVKYLVKRLKLHLSQENRNDLLREIEKKADRGEVLLLLDAFDEQELVCTELQEILSNDNYLQPCRLLITTRPEKLCTMDAAIEVVQVCGLTDDDQKSFVDAYCKNPRARARMLELQQDDANVAVKSTAVMPFCLAIMCFMAEENAETSQPILPFPDSIGCLFANFINMSQKRLDKKYLTYGVNDAEKKVDAMKQLATTKFAWSIGFQVIAELAYKTLQDGTKSFTADQFEAHQFIRELCLNLEFLTTGAGQSLVFMHGTFQEFFACYHLHTNFMKPFFQNLHQNMYSLNMDERNRAYSSIVELSMKLYDFRKRIEDRKEEERKRNKEEQSCMKHFLAFFDEEADITAAEYWDKLNDGGQFITKLKSDIFNRLEVANYFDKFQAGLKIHYCDKILTPTEATVSQFMNLTFRVKGPDPDEEIESTDFDKLAMSLIKLPIVIYADANMGKTTTLARIVEAWHAKKAPWSKYNIILFVPLPRIVDQFETILDMCLAYLLPLLDMKRAKGFVSAELMKHLKNLGSKGEILVILDDLHRMSGKCEELEELLQSNEQRPGPFEMIITMRSHDLTSRNFGTNVQLLHLQGFAELKFAKQYLDDNCRILSQRVSSATNIAYADWIYSPGLLTEACKLIDTGGTDESLINTGIKLWHNSLQDDRINFLKGAKMECRWNRDIICPLAEFAHKMWTAGQKHFFQHELKKEINNANIDNFVFDYYVSRGWIVGQNASATADTSPQEAMNPHFNLHFINNSLQLFLVAYHLWRKSRLVFRTNIYKDVTNLFKFVDQAVKIRKSSVEQSKQRPIPGRFENDGSIG